MALPSIHVRNACIHPKDRRYVFVDDHDPRAPLYRLTCAGHPCIEGDDGIVARFRRGAVLAALAVDYGTTRRAIVAAIRTVMRFEGGVRS